MHLVDECGNNKRKGLVRQSDLSALCNNSAQVLTRLTKTHFVKNSYESNDLTFLSWLEGPTLSCCTACMSPSPPAASVTFHTQHLIHSVPKELTKHSAHPECVHYHSRLAAAGQRQTSARLPLGGLFYSLFFLVDLAASVCAQSCC